MQKSYSLHSSLLVLAIYLYTKYPGIPGGDAGELVAEACQLGVAHPPGYPLFTLVSYVSITIAQKLFGSFNITPANCVNLLCCCLGAGTCYFMNQTIEIYSQGLRLRKNSGINFEKSKNLNDSISNLATPPLAGLLFSLSPLTWEFSIGTEVFALNNFLLTLILYQAAKIDALHSSPLVHLDVVHESLKGAFLCGLALSNQHTSLILELTLIPFVFHILHKSQVMNWTVFISLFIAFLIGLTPYTYLFWNGKTVSEGSWGDTTTLQGFVTHITRSEYGTFQMLGNGNGNEGFWERIAAYGKDTRKQIGYLGIVLALLGIFDTLRLEFFRTGSSMKDKNCTSPRPQKFGSILILSFTFYLIVWNAIFSNLPLDQPMAYAVQSRFWMQPNMILCLLAGLGLNYLTENYAQKIRKRMETGVTAIFLIAFLIGISRMKQTNLLHNQKSGAIISKYGEALLNTIPDDSLLVAHTDLDWNTVRYLRVCEGHSPNMTHLNFQLMPFPWFPKQIHLYPNTKFPSISNTVSTNRKTNENAILVNRFLTANMNTHQYKGGIYIDMQAIKDTDIEEMGTYYGFTLIPWGLTYRVLPKINHQHEIEVPKLHKQSLEQLKSVRAILLPFYNDYMPIYPEGSWEHAGMSVFWDMHYQLGLNMLSFALTIGPRIKKETHLFPLYLSSLRGSSKLLFHSNVASETYGALR